MTNKGKSAWLITWEGQDAVSIGRCKVVAILPPQIGEQTIKLLLRTLFCSESPLTLCGKLNFGTARKKDMQMFCRQLNNDKNPEYSYSDGSPDYLYARRVKQLRCEGSKENDYISTLYWTELAKPTPMSCAPSAPLPNDPSSLIKKVVGEVPQSYTYTMRLPDARSTQIETTS